jgi:murein DD-endopeptidase MepM/ murein hydrolase activator NlpD
VLDRSLAQPVSRQHALRALAGGLHPVLGEPAFHRGIDFSAPAGTPVHASASGVVASIGPAETYGKLVVVSHGEPHAIALRPPRGHRGHHRDSGR